MVAVHGQGQQRGARVVVHRSDGEGLRVCVWCVICPGTVRHATSATVGRLLQPVSRSTAQSRSQRLVQTKDRCGPTPSQCTQGACRDPQSVSNSSIIEHMQPIDPHRKKICDVPWTCSSSWIESMPPPNRAAGRRLFVARAGQAHCPLRLWIGLAPPCLLGVTYRKRRAALPFLGRDRHRRALCVSVAPKGMNGRRSMRCERDYRVRVGSRSKQKKGTDRATSKGAGPLQNPRPSSAH